MTVPDDNDVFQQLTRAIAKYEAISRHPSARSGASSTIIGVMGSLRVNKELPPLPAEDASLSSEDKIPDRIPSFLPPHEGKTARRVFFGDLRTIAAFKPDSHPSTNTDLSIKPPPSLGSRTSASSDAKTCSSIPSSLNFGTSTSDFSTNSPSIRQAAQLLAELEEPELPDLSSPSSPAPQIQPHNHAPLEENSPIQPSSSRPTSYLLGRDFNSLGAGKSPVVERSARPSEASFDFDGDRDSSDFETSPVVDWKPLIPTVSSISSPKPDPRNSRDRRLSGASRPISPLPSQLTRPEHPSSPDLRDYSNKRRSRDQHRLSRASSQFSDDEASSALSSQPICNSSTISTLNLPVEWIYPLRLTLEELFKGGTYTYRITTRLLSGKPKTREVRVHVMPGWATGTRISFPNAGHEYAPGLFQTMIFVVQQVNHPQFTRREDGKLECYLDISHSDARKTNETRAPRRVVGLDGKIIEFSPPRSEIWHGQKMVIKGQGMHKRSKGKVVGRGDLIIRWNVTP
ncbi:hypothetical protein FS837_003249 [Tulasnella sp. UAMH 9824]|nr:hypothetical protein FS837_003249 [Tulasnella sp. UAMH 9824]